ncbi:Uncharacterised protein [Mycobacteroides abscessus subsp. abscessus]|nr:Uncharacterised protein [Mycobacteroides abscessus subsp. abscessus]
MPHLSSETVTDLIEDAWARAIEAAPCIAEPDFEKQDIAKTLIRSVILRWADQNMPAGAGNATHLVAGPYQMSIETPQRTGFRLSLGETVDFRKLCQKPGTPFTLHTEADDATPEPHIADPLVGTRRAF